MPREHLHFVTGRLAEFSLRRLLGELSEQVGFDYSIDVLGITVAALMTCDWVAGRATPPAGTSRIILPGYCQGDPAVVAARTGVAAELGPRDLRRLGEFFGRSRTCSLEEHDIEILAEINHAPRLARNELVSAAAALRADGADVIDLGCDPAGAWRGIGDAVRALVDAGHRVSVDSMNVEEIALATRAGAELVLSVNSANRHAAVDWGCEVVAVPDVPETLAGLDETVEWLATRKVPLRIDPILAPIGFGFARSLGRYLKTRERYPDAEMLMGIGNLSELTDVDSAGVNVLLLGFCQELGIRSVLTTQVINWARSSVRECDLARRLVHYAVRERVLPKHLEPRLVLLRDPSPARYGPEALERMAAEIKDHNYRIVVEDGQIHVLAAGRHWRGDDPFALFEELSKATARPWEPSHLFYLGYEMAKARTALTLDKDYRQDEALDWGFLTAAEPAGGHGKRRQAPAALPNAAEERSP